MLERNDDDCTAAPGLMGQLGCHRYPGCGCWVDYPAQEQDNRTDYQYRLDSWDETLNRALVDIVLSVDLPDDLENRAPQHRQLIKTQADALARQILEYRSAVSAARGRLNNET